MTPRGSDSVDGPVFDCQYRERCVRNALALVLGRGRFAREMLNPGCND